MQFKATYRTSTFRTRTGRLRRTQKAPSISIERAITESGAHLLAGFDEAGVGAWAGPVAVGAVILDPARRIYKVRDSKLIDAERRTFLAARIKERSLAWAVGIASSAEIDDLGMSDARRLAASRAMSMLSIEPDAFLVDGNWNFVGEGAKTIVRGDSKCVSVAAASILAKTARDEMMRSVAGFYPSFGFDVNKGYPTPLHKWALRAFGPTPLHRRLFAPVRALVDQGTPGRLLPPAGDEA